MNGNPIGWFEIYVQDMHRAKAFYERVFAIQLEHLDMPDLEIWTFPMQKDCYGAGGALIHMQGMPSGGGGVLVYFSCEDCALEAARVAGAGGRVEKEKFSIGQYGFISLVIDTEGNRVGLHSMR